VVNAAGTRSAAVAAMNGPAGFAILPVKGQYLVFRRDYESPVRRILFQVPGAAGKGILVTETVYGNLMVGPDALEAADADDLSTDPDSLRAVLAAARRTAPGIDVRRAIRSFAGVRAKPDNGDFNIGLDGGFLTLGGIESPGLTASPAIARAAVRLLAGAGLELAANPRFSGFRAPIVQPGKDMAALAALAPAEAERRIALPPGAPDRLVCRCERVPEARIRDALGRGLPVVSLDAVKRRTRAGQGQCQGGFCGRRTADLLAGELGEEAAAISWEGPGAPPPPERVAGAALRGLES
jgi:glycerol-3-phosphate dehydrogenase